jgi:hypothetical protein
VNSDASNAVLPQPHVSRLTTSAINCTGKSQVFVQFQSHIGTFDATAEQSAILRVSTDLMTWTEKVIFPGLTEQNFFSTNPFFSVADISAVAANKSTVYLQWQWTGNWEYMWDLDDVVLFDANPTPKHDVGISLHLFPASSIAQPESQIATDTFGFAGFLSNAGTETQTNLKLKAVVLTDTDEVIYQDSMIIPALAPGVEDSLFELAGRYAPELPEGAYKIQYSLQADSTDTRPTDNFTEDPFYVTAGLFSKEDGLGSLGGLRPGDGGDWAVGNLYTMSAGSMDDYVATTAQFAFATNSTELPVADVEATVYLFKVDNSVNANFTNFDDETFQAAEFEWVGFANFEAPDTIANYELQTVSLLDVDNSLPGVKLDKGTRYLVAVEYVSPNDVVFHAFIESVDMLFPSTFVYGSNDGTVQWSPFGFGTNENAVLRMTISLATTTDEKPLPESAFKIFPNPVRETLNLGVNFEEATDATITIADLSGRVIVVQDRASLTKEQLTYSLPQLASGTYLARIATKEGTLTKKFVVQK